MSLSPVEEVQERRIGTVEFVSPSEIKVALDLDAPDNTALNAGRPRPFPRINSYLLISSEEGFVVGQVEWLAVERSPFPKRKGFQDFGLIDLPFPLRKLSLSPVGTLTREASDSSANGPNGTKDRYRLRRGVYSFPTVGDPVVMPTDEQLRDIVESGEGRPILIGHAPLAGNAEVRIDPDRLFGRHLAILGNTGSGKSCTVAGLVRWCLETAKSGNATPNARFIILDPNGEYSKVFDSLNPKPRLFKAHGTKERLRVPLWFWNSEEWSSFMQASGKAQRPLLRRALREIRAGRDPLAEDNTEEAMKLELRRYLSFQLVGIRRQLRSNSIKDDATKFGFRLKAIKDDLAARKELVPLVGADVEIVIGQIDEALRSTFNSFTDKSTRKVVEYYNPFSETQTKNIAKALHVAISKLGGIVYDEGPGENTPVPFDGVDFANHLEAVAEQEAVSQFVDTLIIRIRTMLANTEMRHVVAESTDLQLKEWLESYIGTSGAVNGAVAVIDLSLVPSEITHVVIAVIARMVLESLQRYRKTHQDGMTLPTVLVMDEAHTFIRRYKDDAEDISASSVCCQVFERIAREGRKFGLGLVLSSQRPSELSQTVLSQCNTFILHRISNDRDQEAVSKLLPDHLRGILKELPVLPTRHAFLLGWATELPVLTQIRELALEHQPQSQDPDFWAVWTGKDQKGLPVKRDVDWRAIADAWQDKVSTTTPESSDSNSISTEASDAVLTQGEPPVG